MARPPTRTALPVSVAGVVLSFAIGRRPVGAMGAALH